MKAPDWVTGFYCPVCEEAHLIQRIPESKELQALWYEWAVSSAQCPNDRLESFSGWLDRKNKFAFPAWSVFAFGLYCGLMVAEYLL